LPEEEVAMNREDLTKAKDLFTEDRIDKATRLAKALLWWLVVIFFLNVLAGHIWFSFMGWKI
jgi:hypothetical protein